MFTVTGSGIGAPGSSLAAVTSITGSVPERLGHQRHVAGEPDVLLAVRGAGEAVGLLRPGERALDARSARGGAGASFSPIGTKPRSSRMRRPSARRERRDHPVADAARRGRGVDVELARLDRCPSARTRR